MPSCCMTTNLFFAVSCDANCFYLKELGDKIADVKRMKTPEACEIAIGLPDLQLFNKRRELKRKYDKMKNIHDFLAY